MSYAGYLIKVGDYEIPADKYIKSGTYIVTRNSQDLDSYRDVEGVLHRVALNHHVVKIEFETPPMLTNEEFSAFLKNIQNNYINENEKKVEVTAYVPELDDYLTLTMYMPDISFSFYGIFDNVIKFNAARIAFIEY